MVTRILFAIVGLISIALSAPSGTSEYFARANLKTQEKRSSNFTPSGGVGVSPSSPPPKYRTQTDFDFQSFNLALNQEYIELDLFHHGLAVFSDEEFEAAGLNAEDRFLIEWMADQEVGHARLLTNILGKGRAALQCEYQYPFTDVKGFIDFCQKLTRFGEAGVYGFLAHLNCRDCATLLTQSIVTEARQQLIFRQFEGLFPMPVWFETGIPQSWAWTLLAPYLKTCPAENPRIEWQNFPALNITNNPYPPDVVNNTAAITHNVSALTYGGRRVDFSWELPGKKVSYNDSYVTTTNAGQAKYALWVQQLNATYTELYGINGTTAYTFQPNVTVFPGTNDYQVNDTSFVAIVDAKIPVTPYNLSLINPHVVAGPALYQSG